MGVTANIGVLSLTLNLIVTLTITQNDSLTIAPLKVNTSLKSAVTLITKSDQVGPSRTKSDQVGHTHYQEQTGQQPLLAKNKNDSDRLEISRTTAA